jgi:hypothetical protein
MATATVLDELVVKLGLDPKEFDEGQKKAAAAWLKARDAHAKAAKEMESRSKAVAQGLSKVRNEVLALGAALLGAAGIEQFISKMTRADAATGRLARQLNISASDLSAWQGAAEHVGGTAEGMAGSLTSLSDQMQQLATTGNAGIVPYLRALNSQMGAVQISFTDAAGAARPVTEVMKDIITDLNLLNRTNPAQASYLARQLGIDPAMIALSREELDKLLASQKQLANLNSRDTAAAQTLQSAWADLSRVFEDSGRKILTELTPALSELMKDFAKFVTSHKDDIVQWAKDLGAYIRDIDWQAVKTGLEDFGHGLQNVSEAVGGLTHLLELLFGLWVGAKFLAMMSSVGLLSGALSGLGSMASLALGPAGLGFALGMEPTPVAPGTLDKKSESNYKESYEAFKKLGWSDAAAHGLAMAEGRESGFNPNEVGDKGQAYGAFQWHPDRQAAFAAMFGHNIRQSTIDEQRRFVDWELRRGGEQRAGRILGNPNLSRSDAVTAVDEEYERSAAGQARKLARGAPVAPDPGVAPDLAGVNAGTVAPGRSSAQPNVDASAEVNVNTINVNGVDPNNAEAVAGGIKGGIKRAMQKYQPVVPQFNPGLM